METVGAALDEDMPGISPFLASSARQHPLTSAEWMRMGLLSVFSLNGEPGSGKKCVHS